MAEIFALIAGIFHVLFFFIESVLWGRPGVNKSFGLKKEEAEICRELAFNQGFYNLFLAFGAFYSVALLWMSGGESSEGGLLLVFSCLSMFGASVVLLLSKPKLLRAALIQGLPPVLAVIFYFLG